MTSPVLWYVDRGSGLVALLLLTITVVLGVISSSRVRSEQWPRFALAQLNRNLALLAVTFGAVHVVSAVVDTFVPITLGDAFIPFQSAYKPLWIAVGAIGVDLMLAVLITSAVRRRIGYRSWRSIHMLSYGVWAAAMVHAIGIGSDVRSAVWAVVVIAACVGAGAGAIVQRRLPAHPH